MTVRELLSVIKEKGNSAVTIFSEDGDVTVTYYSSDVYGAFDFDGVFAAVETEPFKYAGWITATTDRKGLLDATVVKVSFSKYALDYFSDPNRTQYNIEVEPLDIQGFRSDIDYIGNSLMEQLREKIQGDASS